MYLVKKSGLIPSSWNVVLRGPTVETDLKLELKPPLKRNENKILLMRRHAITIPKEGLGRREQQTLHDQLWGKDQIVSCYSRCHKVTAPGAAESRRCLSKPSSKPWKMYDFGISELSKNTRNAETLSSFAKTRRPFVYIKFPPPMCWK